MFCLTLTLTSSFVGYFLLPGPLGVLKSVSGDVFRHTDSIGSFLSLRILTTHICVENIALASMNCCLFDLIYKVMIMCERHQLMYIAIITPSKPTRSPDCRCISSFFWQQSPKCQFLGQIATPKITHIYRQFLIQIICSKLKSLHLQQTSRSDLGI